MARELTAAGMRVSVISGGLGAWRKANLPVEQVPADEVIPLPRFA